jgi:hypothetical protein
MLNRLFAMTRFVPDTSPTLPGGITVDGAATSSATCTPCTPSLSIKMPTTTRWAHGAAPASTAGSTTAHGSLPAAAAPIARARTATKRPRKPPQHPRLAAKADLRLRASLSRRPRVLPKASRKVCLEIGIGALSKSALPPRTNLTRRNGRY